MATAAEIAWAQARGFRVSPDGTLDGSVTDAYAQEQAALLGYDAVQPYVKAPGVGSGTPSKFTLPLPNTYTPRRRKWLAASVQHLFQAGHTWAATGTYSSVNLNDTATAHPVLGTQSVKITTSGTGALGGVKIIAASAVDMTGKMFRITLKVDDVSHLKDMWLYAGDTNLANYYVFKVDTHSGTVVNIANSGQWITYHVGWADIVSGSGTRTVAGGVPTGGKTGITDLRFQVADDNLAVSSVVHLQAIEVVTEAQSATPILLLSFDDTWKSQLTAVRYMFSKGVAGTFFTIADQVSVDGSSGTRLALSDLNAMQESGHEIAGHAYRVSVHNAGITSLTAAQLHEELRYLKAWMAVNGFLSDSFAYPLGKFDFTTDGVACDEIVRIYFPLSARTITPNTLQNHAPPAMPHRLYSRSGISSFTGGKTVASLIAAGAELERVRQSGGVFSATFHEVVTSPTSTNQCSTADFQSLVDYGVTNGFTFMTHSDFMRQYGV